MSKATRMAGALEGFADALPAYGFEPKPLRNTAAHLRALDASHRQLLAAAEAAIAYDVAIESCANDPDRMSSFCTAEGTDLDDLYFSFVHLARSAIAAAKELT